jgi:hypothetical protein
MQPSVSSAYSQPSIHTKRRPVASSHYGDVSPPDSPRGYEVQKATSSGDVSPVDNGFDPDVHPAFRGKSKPGMSQIPRRIGTGETPVANRAYKRDLSAPLKWDKYTGEPTTSNKGIPSNVKPIQVVKGLEQTRLTPVPIERRDEDTMMVDSRPPWKGASGRAAIVQPVKTKPDASPFTSLNVQKTSGMPTPPQSLSPTNDRNDIYSETETRSVSDFRTRQGSIETNDPMASSVTSQSIDTSVATTPTMTGYPSPPLGKEDLDRTPPVSQGKYMSIDSSPVSTHTVRTYGRNRVESKTGANPDSRFSWTTLNTNTTYQHSPPPSPPPPLPHTMAIHTNSNSIMNRTRPVPSNRNYSPGSSSPIVPDAPPFASYRAVSGQVSRPDSGESAYPKRSGSHGNESFIAAKYAPSIASTTAGGNKALPPTPQELNSKDHASQLEAQLADLRLQRSNIERVLRDMTRPSATHALMTNFLVEREREKRVGALKEELYSIGMMEHALGLQLHRVNRRKEREDGYEGFTTLWVRRATGLTTDP